MIPTFYWLKKILWVVINALKFIIDIVTSFSSPSLVSHLSSPLLFPPLLSSPLPSSPLLSSSLPSSPLLSSPLLSPPLLSSPLLSSPLLSSPLLSSPLPSTPPSFWSLLPRPHAGDHKQHAGASADHRDPREDKEPDGRHAGTSQRDWFHDGTWWRTLVGLPARVFGFMLQRKARPLPAAHVGDPVARLRPLPHQEEVRSPVRA